MFTRSLKLLVAIGAVLMTAASTATAASLRPRQLAPDFTANAVDDAKFTKFTLSDVAAAGQWTVLLFYPFDWTFVCPTELIAFSERVPEFAAANARIVGVSTDSHHTHMSWIKASRDIGGLGGINFPLVADISKRISREYGVLVEEEDDGMHGAALRGLFLIDPTGKIRSITINDDAVGRSVDETLRLVLAFQHADEHGEVCPANWKKGDVAFKPTPTGVAGYMSEHLAAKAK